MIKLLLLPIVFVGGLFVQFKYEAIPVIPKIVTVEKEVPVVVYETKIEKVKVPTIVYKTKIEKVPTIVEKVKIEKIYVPKIVEKIKVVEKGCFDVF